jgi:hypothetical protein
MLLLRCLTAIVHAVNRYNVEYLEASMVLVLDAEQWSEVDTRVAATK